MWATTNHHVEIAKLLLDHGASLETKTGTGRTAWDFISLDPDISQFVSTHGYPMGTVGVTGDYYDGGFSQDRLEDDVAEQDMKRRLLMESAANLEVDLASLGLNENLDVCTVATTGTELVLTITVA